MIKRYLIYTLGTGLGSGYMPVAPGTAGSLLALFFYFIFPFNTIYWLIIILLFFISGVWSSTQIEKDKGKDPAIVVIDEIVGQWLAIIFLPSSSITLLIGFILFRGFDIWKPYPINKTQKLKAGWGIMIDDAIAGVYANIVLHFIYWTGLF